MKPLTAEWVGKAEGDFSTLERECRVRKNPNYDGVCFHAAQCAEKYLKARLCEGGIDFPKTHDLVALLELVLRLEPPWEIFRKDLAILTEYAVSIRYPGEMADRESAVAARRSCKSFRATARGAIGL
ncbi:MAG: HEPN domain-containing protein [Myxococcota bacterium]